MYGLSDQVWGYQRNLFLNGEVKKPHIALGTKLLFPLGIVLYQTFPIPLPNSRDNIYTPDIIGIPGINMFESILK